MPINELKCIEVLMRYLAQNSKLTQEIHSEFDETATYEHTKTNLFNLLTIFDLIENFDINQPFSLEYFLKTGVIIGMFEEPTITPDEDFKNKQDYLEFYKNLVEAFKEGNYLFDDTNNIFVSSEKLETVIPQIWLDRLSQAVKHTKYQRMYFFNKKKENNITDKNSLIDYIRHTKTFLVELSSSNPNIDYDLEFSSTEAKTNNAVRGNREIKIEDIIQIFQEQLSSECDCKISKYKLSDAFFLVSKAERMGREFYCEPLQVQQKYLNKWMLEYINSNERTKKETQKLILLANPKNIHGFDIESINKRDALIGLFNLYLRIMSTLELDLESVSLADFKIEDYVSPETQHDLLELRKIIKLINGYGDSKAETGKRLEEIRIEIADLDLIKDKKELKAKKEEREALVQKYRTEEDLEDELGYTRNILQERVRQANQSAIESIAFDNDLIMELILECIAKGRVYFEHNTNRIVFELYNDTLGKVIFKTSINLEKAVIFTEDNNFKIDGYSSPTLR